MSSDSEDEGNASGVSGDEGLGDGGHGGGRHATGGEDDGVALLAEIDRLEEMLRNLKRRVEAADGNRALEVSCVRSECEHLQWAVNRLHHNADAVAKTLAYEIFAPLSNPNDFLGDGRGIDDFWDTLLWNIRALGAEGVAADLLEECFFVKLNNDGLFDRVYGSTLLHLVCQMNPPVEVVKAMLEIIPENAKDDREAWKYYSSNRWNVYPKGQFNHLGLNDDQEYPLHLVMKHGGSTALVDLLITVDVEARTLIELPHILISNRAEHDPQAFAKLLRHLARRVGLHPDEWYRARGTERSPLLHYRNKGSGAISGTPIRLLWESLKKSGLSHKDILRDNDFIFLLKATCHHQSLKNRKDQGTIRSMKEKAMRATTIEEIERIPLFQAFLICCSCFCRQATGLLDHLFSVDPQFLLQKDADGNYPFHQILQSRSYLIQFNTELIHSVLLVAPQCARQVDGAGRLLLHMVADPKQTAHLTDRERLDLVNLVWEVYPEAAETLDACTGLPAFVLSLKDQTITGSPDPEEERDISDADWSCASKRLARSRKQRKREDPAREAFALSNAFFLLRKHPGVLQVPANENKLSSGEACQPAKRRKSYA